MIRSILAPILGTALDATTLAGGVHVALAFNAQLEALFVRADSAAAIPLVAEGIAAPVVDQLLRTAEREWAVREQAARASFDAILAAAPTAVAASWRVVEGREMEVMAREAPLHDLVVLGHSRDDEDEPQRQRLLEAALLDGGRPVLLVPESLPRRIGARIAIAWKGGPAGSHSVAAALPFLTRAESVVVLTAATSRTETGLAEGLIGYLGRHGITAEARPVESADGGVGTRLLASVARDGADLLVMGAYGHGRLRELLGGGVTRHVVRHAELPVLMVH